MKYRVFSIRCSLSQKKSIVDQTGGVQAFEAFDIVRIDRFRLAGEEM